MNKSLGQKVKTLRLKKGLSQEVLAELSGLSIRTIQRIEKENKNPSGDSLKRLSKALEVSPDYLLEWEPNENSKFLSLLAISPLLFIVNPFLGLLVPLILWLSKKNKIKGVKHLGSKIIKTQLIWLILYFLFRTINYFRVSYKINNTPSIIEDPALYFSYDLNSQFYLKIFFILINISIILLLFYKTFTRNRVNQKIVA